MFRCLRIIWTIFSLWEWAFVFEIPAGNEEMRIGLYSSEVAWGCKQQEKHQQWGKMHSSDWHGRNRKGGRIGQRVNTCCICAVLVFLRAPVNLCPLSKYLVWLKGKIAAAISRAFLMRRARLVALGCDPKKPCPSNCHMCLSARKSDLHSRCYSDLDNCILFLQRICAGFFSFG